MVRIVRLFGVLMLVTGMLASSLVPVFAQDDPGGSPVAEPTETEVVQPTETVIAEPTETEVAPPQGSNGMQPASFEGDDDFSAAALYTGFLTLTTSDGLAIPAGSRVTVTNITGGGSTIVSTFPLLVAWPSGVPLTIVPLPALPKNAVIRVDVSAAGYVPFSQTYTLGNILFNISGTLQKEPEKASVDLTITMTDGGLIPDGMTWSFQTTGYAEIEGGTVPSGSASGWNVPLTNKVTPGSYVLYVATPEATYRYFYVVGVSLPTTSLLVTFDRMTAVDLTITMTDGGLIPDGMTWSFQTTDYTELESGSVPDGSASGWNLALANKVKAGSYVLLVKTPDEQYYYFYVVVVSGATTNLPVSFVRVIPQATVDITITMTDGGLIPDGMVWSFQTADNLYTEIEGGAVPDGSASGWTVALTNPVPEGSYVLLVRTPDDLYKYFYVVVVNAPATTLPVNFDRVQGDLTATFVTSDGGDVPAGTTWSITDADSNVVQSGTLASDQLNGSLLPNTNPIAYGEYVLTVTADGYLPYASSFTVNQAATAFNINLQVVPPTTGTVNLTVETEDDGEIPNGTIITIGGVAQVVNSADASFTTADAASGTVFVFTNVPAGTQPLTVTNAGPYADLTDEVDVEAGSAVDATIVLQLEPTPTPTPTETITPEPTETVTPEPTATATVTPTQTPVVPTATATAAPGKTPESVAVKTLPKTGQGAETASGLNSMLLAVAAVLLLAATAGVIGNRFRRQDR